MRRITPGKVSGWLSIYWFAREYIEQKFYIHYRSIRTFETRLSDAPVNIQFLPKYCSHFKEPGRLKQALRTTLFNVCFHMKDRVHTEGVLHGKTFYSVKKYTARLQWWSFLTQEVASAYVCTLLLFLNGISWPAAVFFVIYRIRGTPLMLLIRSNANNWHNLARSVSISTHTHANVSWCGCFTNRQVYLIG